MADTCQHMKYNIPLTRWTIILACWFDVLLFATENTYSCFFTLVSIIKYNKHTSNHKYINNYKLESIQTTLITFMLHYYTTSIRVLVCGSKSSSKFNYLPNNCRITLNLSENPVLQAFSSSQHKLFWTAHNVILIVSVTESDLI